MPICGLGAFCRPDMRRGSDIFCMLTGAYAPAYCMSPTGVGFCLLAIATQYYHHFAQQRDCLSSQMWAIDYMACGREREVELSSVLSTPNNDSSRLQEVSKILFP